MICSACGKDNPEGSWVCGSCGEALPVSSQPSSSSNSLLPKSSPTPDRTTGGGAIVKFAAITVVGMLAAFSVWFFLLRGPDTSTPGGTMEAYINAISEKDCEKVYEYVPAAAVPENRDQAVDSCNQFVGLFNIDFTDYKTLEETVDGDNASVTFQITIKASSQAVTTDMTMQLIKEGGKWKVEPQ
ncbi:MAG: hypothetical protein WC828_05325 [Thermoleophilia bacterium]|jgi:uncharacterized membrane protein YvbJ